MYIMSSRIGSRISSQIGSIISNPADYVITVGSGNLWVGSDRATERDFIRKHRIRAVVSLVPPRDTLTGVRYYTYTVADSSSDLGTMQTVVRSATPIIHRHLLAGHNVLVHCHMGIQRAPSVVWAYLTKHLSNVERLFATRSPLERIIQARPVAFLHGMQFTWKLPELLEVLT